MSDDNTSILGSGWTFPPIFDPANKEILLSTEEENVQQNLYALFGTEQGERLSHSDYGGNLQRFLFAGIDTHLVNDIKAIVTNSIKLYEPRILLDSINIGEREDEPGVLLISIDYSLRTTHARHSMVFPFYLNEVTFPDF